MAHQQASSSGLNKSKKSRHEMATHSSLRPDMDPTLQMEEEEEEEGDAVISLFEDEEQTPQVLDYNSEADGSVRYVLYF